MLDIKDLKIKFNRTDHLVVKGINLHIEDGEILGLVGESGSGKSVTALSIAGLLSSKICEKSGEIYLDNEELLSKKAKEMDKIRGKDISIVFQDPLNYSDPLMKIGKQVEESLLIHTDFSKKERKEKALKALEDVELKDVKDVYNKYPYELSGGMCQRAMIASAIINRPKLLLLDEITTALDISIQNQIIKLLQKLNKKYHMSILFISHNLNVVRKLCSRVCVMQKGIIVEEGKMEDVFTSPSHPYTKKLIDSIPFLPKEEEL